MIKNLALSLMLLLGGAHAADDVTVMTFEESPITLKKVTYQEEKIQKFNDLVWEFHKADMSGTQEHIKHFSSQEAYESWAKSHLDKRAQMLKGGQDELVIFYKDGEMIGGTYYIQEDGGKTIRVTCAGYKLEGLTSQELGLIQGGTFQYMGSKENFPDGERLIVLLRHNSSNADKLKMLGFDVSNYICEEFSKDEYTSYERKIS